MEIQYIGASARRQFSAIRGVALAWTCCAALTWLSEPALAAGYSYTTIATSTLDAIDPSIASFQAAPSINDAGSVAFAAAFW